MDIFNLHPTLATASLWDRRTMGKTGIVLEDGGISISSGERNGVRGRWYIPEHNKTHLVSLSINWTHEEKKSRLTNTCTVRSR
jgi:hypothetical protein